MNALLDRLPAPLRPREGDDGGGPARRAIELLALIAIGVLLATATVYDLSKQVQTDIRMRADRTAWLSYEHLAKAKMNLIPGPFGTTKDRACGRPHYGATYRDCLVIAGPTANGHREVIGGYRLPLVGLDLYRHRSDCFGEPLREGLCPPS